jgi:hypothetical protein
MVRPRVGSAPHSGNRVAVDLEPRKGQAVYTSLPGLRGAKREAAPIGLMSASTSYGRSAANAYRRLVPKPDSTHCSR